jgi:hypothetical protein
MLSAITGKKNYTLGDLAYDAVEAAEEAFADDGESGQQTPTDESEGSQPDEKDESNDDSNNEQDDSNDDTQKPDQDEPAAGTPDEGSSDDDSSSDETDAGTTDDSTPNPDSVSGDNPNPDNTVSDLMRAAYSRPTVMGKGTVSTPADPYAPSAEQMEAQMEAMESKLKQRQTWNTTPVDHGDGAGGQSGGQVEAELPSKQPVIDPGSPTAARR